MYKRQEYIQKHNIKQAYTEKSRNEIIADTVDVLPYEGRSFYVTYDNEHIDELLDDLYKNDLRYINDYHDISSLLQAQENNSQMITIFGLVVFIVGCIVILSMKYVQREETKQVYHLMRNQGLSRSSYFKMMLLQWLEDTLFICAMSSILGYGLSFVLNTLNIGYTEYNAFVIVIFLIVSSTVCLLLPMISDYLTLRYEKC